MLTEKIQRLNKFLSDRKIDTLVTGNLGHEVRDELLYWLTGITFEYGILIVTQGRKPELYITSFEVEMYQPALQGIDVKPFASPLKDILSGTLHHANSVAYRASSATRTLYDQLVEIYGESKLTPLIDDHLLRYKKSNDEVARIRRACAVTDRVFTAILAHWSKFDTERSVANYIHQSINHLGYEASFPPIVASGANAANPHHVPSNTPILPGFCVIDMGARVGGYCSDMTRTVYVGEPTDAEQDLYLTLLHAEDATIDLVSPRVTVAELDNFVRDRLGSDLSKEFIHALGHGLGTAVHEYPSVSKRADVTLESGMVITIEPGVYRREAYGIRIEDDVLVTDSGYEVLTKSPKLLTVVSHKKTL
jgi:Xaa-Pro aminopeptidase